MTYEYDEIAVSLGSMYRWRVLIRDQYHVASIAHVQCFAVLCCTVKCQRCQTNAALARKTGSKFLFLCANHQMARELRSWDFHVQVDIHMCDMVEEVECRRERFLA